MYFTRLHRFNFQYQTVFLRVGKSNQMCASGGHNLGTLGRDDDTVGIDKKVVLEDVGDGHRSQLQMCSLCGNHFGRFSRDNGTVGVFNKAVVDIGSHRSGSPCSRLDSPGHRLHRPSHRLDSPNSMHSSALGMVDLGSSSVVCNGVVDTCGFVEGSLGSSDGRGVGRNQSAVGVANKVVPACKLPAGDRHTGRKNLKQ